MTTIARHDSQLSIQAWWDGIRGPSCFCRAVLCDGTCSTTVKVGWVYWGLLGPQSANVPVLMAQTTEKQWYCFYKSADKLRLKTGISFPLMGAWEAQQLSYKKVPAGREMKDAHFSFLKVKWKVQKLNESHSYTDRRCQVQTGRARSRMYFRSGTYHCGERVTRV